MRLGEAQYRAHNSRPARSRNADIGRSQRAADANASPTPLAERRATESLAAQGRTETPAGSPRRAPKLHIAARAATRNFFARRLGSPWLMTHARAFRRVRRTTFRRLPRLLPLALPPPTNLLAASCSPFLALAIAPLGLVQRPRPRGLAAGLAAVATPRAVREELPAAPLEQTLANARPARGSLYFRRSRDMLEWAHGRLSSRKVKSRIEAANFNPRRLFIAAASTPRPAILSAYRPPPFRCHFRLNIVAPRLRPFNPATTVPGG